MQEVFSVKNLVIYLLCINIVSFLAMYIDKKKAIKNERRISEKTLLMLCVVGGSIGGFIGMYKFRHKTKKAKFNVGIPIILTAHIVCGIILFLEYIN